jgi:uncharacterized CHY-type Zn-finger protein
MRLKYFENQIVCAKCGEVLFREDVETYNACPYCDSKFPENGELDDFFYFYPSYNWNVAGGGRHTYQATDF